MGDNPFEQKSEPNPFQVRPSPAASPPGVLQPLLRGDPRRRVINACSAGIRKDSSTTNAECLDFCVSFLEVPSVKVLLLFEAI
jgi:hypothetical protein